MRITEIREGKNIDCVEREREKNFHDLKVLGGMEEANKRKEKRKCNAASNGMKADCQPQTFVCINRDNSSI